MAAADIVMPKDFVPARMSYSQPKQLNNGGRTVYVSYFDRPLVVQTPFMSAPFGVSVWPSDNGGPDKYNIDASFDGKDNNDALRNFFDMLNELDQKVLQDAMENSQLWLKKSYPRIDVIEELYTPTIKYAKDKNTGEISNQYAPKFKMTLPFKDGRFQFKTIDDKKADIDLMDILQSDGRGKGARVRALVSCNSIWVVGKKFGLTWKVRMLEIHTKPRAATLVFQSTGEDEEAPNGEMENLKVVNAPAPASKCPMPPLSSDEEDEGNADEGDELENGV